MYIAVFKFLIYSIIFSLSLFSSSSCRDRAQFENHYVKLCIIVRVLFCVSFPLVIYILYIYFIIIIIPNHIIQDFLNSEKYIIIDNFNL